MPPRRKAAQKKKEEAVIASVTAPSPPVIQEKAPTAVAAAAAAPSPSPSPPAPVVVDAHDADDAAGANNDNTNNTNNNASRLFTSPGHRFLSNFQDLFSWTTSRVLPSFQEFEAELNVRREIKHFSLFLFLLLLCTSGSPFLFFSFPLPPTNKPQTELSSLAELAGELHAARTKSEAKLRLERRKLMALKSVIEDIADDDADDAEGDDGGNGGGDPFGDADTVAGRSSGVFSDPVLEDL